MDISASQPAPTVPSAAEALHGLLLGVAAASAAARGSSGEAPGAEATLLLCLMDGLADAVEWAQRGVGADDVACLWLGALRWVRAVDGAVPDGAPEPPTRTVASMLGRLPGVATPANGTETTGAAGPAGGDPQNLIGLRSPEMSQPHRPFNRPAATVPELASTNGPGVLARGLGIGLLSYASEEDARRLATWSAAFSHGSPAAHEAAADAATLMRALRSGGVEGAGALLTALRQVLGEPEVEVQASEEADSGAADGTAREALRRGVGHVVAALEAGTSPWSGALAAAGEGDEAAAIVAGAIAGALSGPAAVPSARVADAERAGIETLVANLGPALG